ncbi:DUF5610 domain-containing protein [Thiorhodococcus minor]|uniref:DUF5610 domain-containing protein n=1 Tax=Thiorhodococcus minor TaxID=57489 RepID=A0A6M0JXS5_9GAMM|nr:DUF5610 domain-containing protein [Thiorhodococcus minor]NEV61781.1 hypothetical protein [Thiorhodococcus minor]
MAILTNFSLSNSYSLSNSFTLKSFDQNQHQLGKTGSEPADALSGLQDKALESLAREIPGVEAAGLKALDPAEYTPDKIAERISGFVAQGLESARAQGKSEEEIQSLYDSAVKGVEQGFKEAKQILSNLDMLNGAIADQVQATEEATFDALAGLSPTQEQQGITGARTMAVAERYAQAEDFQLELKTQEGDTVRISFGKTLEAQAGYAMTQDGQGNSAAVLDISRSEQSGYSFSVEGDLSVDEIDAIQSLVQDVSEVANDFFSGDVQEAFEQVSEISFDSSQLSAMNLHMSQSQQYSAVQRYQETQQMDSPAASKPGLRLGHMMREFGDSFARPGLQFLDQADKVASRIMEGLVEQDTRFKQSDSDQQGAYQDNLQRMLSALESVE